MSLSWFKKKFGMWKNIKHLIQQNLRKRQESRAAFADDELQLLRGALLDVAINHQQHVRKNTSLADIFTDYNVIDFALGEGFLRGFDHIMTSFPDTIFHSIDDDVWGDGDLFLTWGNVIRTQSHKRYSLMVSKMLEENKTLVIAEDGFIRSVANHASLDVDYSFRKGFSVTFDDLGPYYSAYLPSRLELMLRDANVTADQRREARALINRVCDHFISKYNHQPLLNFEKMTEGSVLVVDQVYTDYSLRKGGGGVSGLKRMLRDALKENANKKIFLKIHPDNIVLSSNHKSFYGDLLNHRNLQIIGHECNPIALMRNVDKVYVFSSQLGFEALMLGKSVITYGVPFYAGWGLTEDRHWYMQTQEMRERRPRSLSIEEVFHIAYREYTHYVDKNRKRSSLERVIDLLIDERRAFFEKYKVRDDFNVI